jgi:uncharacterized membrane protein/protein-disulfide isomerase
VIPYNSNLNEIMPPVDSGHRAVSNSYERRDYLRRRMGRARFRAAAVLAVAGFLISAVLTYLHLRAVADPQGYKSFCNISPGVNCDAVALSKYAVVLGVPNSVFGALFYVLVAALSIAGFRAGREVVVRRAGHLFILLSVSLLYSFYLAGISYFRLKTLCILCSGLYGVNLALFLVVGSLARGSPPKLIVHLIHDSLALVRSRFAPLAGAACTALILVVGFRVLEGQARSVAAERFLAEYTTITPIPIPETSSVAFGPEGAPVTIVEFYDYRCPSCKEAHGLLRPLLERYPTQIRLVLRDYPQCYDCWESDDPKELPVPCILPLVARHAHAEGKWWEMSEALFAQAGRLESWGDVLKLAGGVGLDTAGVTGALAGGDLLSELRTDIIQARWFGIDEVPSFAVNGRVLPVVPSREMLDAIIGFELTRRVGRSEEQGGGSAR